MNHVHDYEWISCYNCFTCIVNAFERDVKPCSNLPKTFLLYEWIVPIGFLYFIIVDADNFFSGLVLPASLSQQINITFHPAR